MSKYYVQKENKDSKYRLKCWEIATGLQKIDGLTPSNYLYELANKHINNECTINEVEEKIKQYYENETLEDIADRKKEADLVTAKITDLLNDNSFTFSPEMLKHIHKVLFEDIYDHAGKFRECNIKKSEPILHGETVNYANYQMIYEIYKYDFMQEKEYKYSNKTPKEIVDNISKFTSSIWQVHPFMEGNTRTTAVFLEKYLNTVGFNVNNDLFKENALYFRNALVRSNYANYQKGIDPENIYLERFFENLLFNGKHILQNRDMIIKQNINKDYER